MLKQARNKVFIEGILSEIDLDYGSYQKNGKTMECIRGTIKILVNQNINGIPTNNEIPVQMFANKFTAQGAPNIAYEKMEDVKNNFISIAAVGSESNADRVYCTADISMNEFYDRDGRFISSPRLRTSFVNRVRKDEFKSRAEFEVEMVVANMSYKVDAEGAEVEPKRYQIKGIVPQYGGKVDIVDFVCLNEKTIEGASSAMDVNDTVKIKGVLNFTSSTETITQEVDFGEPIVRQRTISTKDFVVTGGVRLDGDFAYDLTEIQTALTERKQRLEAQKEKDMMRQRKAPAPANEVSHGALDLGF